MKKKDFNDFKVSLNLSVEIDASLRRITEKIKLLHQLRDSESLRYVLDFLRSTDGDIDELISNNLKDDVEE